MNIGLSSESKVKVLCERGPGLGADDPCGGVGRCRLLLFGYVIDCRVAPYDPPQNSELEPVFQSRRLGAHRRIIRNSRGQVLYVGNSLPIIALIIVGISSGT